MLVFLNFCKISVCRMCSVVFLAFTLKLRIQTSLSVAPKLTVSACSNGKCGKLSKTSTPPLELKKVKKNMTKQSCTTEGFAEIRTDKDN